MNEKLNFVVLGAFILTGTFFLPACVVVDYGRSGAYRLAFQEGTADTSSESERREHLIQSFRSLLVEHGYKEWKGKRPFWSNQGAYVSWKSGENGELTLTISAFGDKSALRKSEQIELELLRLVTLYPDVKVARVEPTRVP